MLPVTMHGQKNQIRQISLVNMLKRNVLAKKKLEGCLASPFKVPFISQPCILRKRLVKNICENMYYFYSQNFFCGSLFSRRCLCCSRLILNIYILLMLFWPILIFSNRFNIFSQRFFILIFLFFFFQPPKGRLDIRHLTVPNL